MPKKTNEKSEETKAKHRTAIIVAIIKLVQEIVIAIIENK